MNDPLAVGYLLSGGFAVLAWALLIGRLKARSAVLKQLEVIPVGPAPPAPVQPSGIPGWAAMPTDLLTPLGRWLFAAQRRRVEKWLRLAGGSGLTADRFLGFKLTLCLWAAILGSLRGPLWLGIFLLAAYFGTDQWLQQKARRRQQALAAEVPNLLDLASTCLKGGMTVHSVLQLAADVWREGPLRDELQIVRRELDLHQPLDSVLDDLIRRTECEELSTCVQAFCQGNSLGVPVAEATRTQAGILRHQRVEKAKELAHKAEAKITLVSTVMAMPTTFLFVAGSLLYALFSRPEVFGFQWFRP